MNLIKKLFEKRDNKTLVNILTVFAVGIGLIFVGGLFDKGGGEGVKPENDKTSEETEAEPDYKTSLEHQLEEILSRAEGVGRIKVMISLNDSGEDRLAEDVSRESRSGNGENSEREEHKTLLTEGDQPYIINKRRPEIEGILIIAEGGGSVEVKSSLIGACEALFGIEANKIEVLKMGGN